MARDIVRGQLYKAVVRMLRYSQSILVLRDTTV